MAGKAKTKAEVYVAMLTPFAGSGVEELQLGRVRRREC